MSFISTIQKHTFAPEVYSEPCQTSKMKLFADIFDAWITWTIFPKSSILDVWQGSGYFSVSVNAIFTWLLIIIRSSLPEVFCKKGVLRYFTKFTGKHLCQSLFFKAACLACNFIKKWTLAQVFSCECCEIFKNTFSYRTRLVAASE